MKMKKILALVLALCLTASALVGCAGAPAATESKAAESKATESKAEESKTEAPATEATGMYPGTPGKDEITVDLGTEPPSLNSVTATYAVAFNVLRHTTENLVTLDETDTVQPGVAESWTISDDKLNYKFKLREGTKWTNGEPVTARDFVFAWSELLNPQVASEYAYMAFIFKNAEKYYNGECKIEDVGFKAVSDYELEVTMENPIAYGLFMFSHGSFAPVNEKFYKEIGANNYAIDADKFCSNGAFTVESWTHDSDIVLKKNPDFHNADKVSLNKIKFTMFKDANAALNSFKAGEVDMIPLIGDQMVQLAAEGYPTLDYSDGAEFHVLLNNKDKYMSNVNLRRAIHYGVDRTAYVKAIRKDHSSPATCFTNPGVSGSDGKSFAAAVEAKHGILNPQTADVEKAKGYLDTAMKELNCTIEDLNANMSMNCGDSTGAKLQAEFFQEQLRNNLGIEMQVKSMTTKAQSEERVNGNFVMDFTGWSPDYNDPMSFIDMWVTGGGNNSVKFSNARYDELVDKAAKEVDVAKRQEYFLECEKIIAEELPVSATYWRMVTYINSEKLGEHCHRSTFQDMNYIYATVK